MMVNGPLEIYSTVIGARLFDNIFNIMASTGLAFLPFLSLFFHNITTPYESEITNGADTSLRRVMIHFFTLVFFIMIFAAPTHKLDVSSITYKPVCSVGAEVSRYGDTGTTYDNVFGDFQYQDIRIPVGLAFVLGGASGITNAAIVSLPCETDVQKMQDVINTTELTPALTQEVGRFNSECFSTARAEFNNTHPDSAKYQSILDASGGESDLSWMGSHVFQKLYYADLYPSDPVSSFPYQAYPYQYQDYNKKAGVDTPKGGYPSCLAWWADAEYGLENRLVNLVKANQPNNPHLGTSSIEDDMTRFLSKAKSFTHVGSQVTAKDVIVRNLLYPNANGGFGASNTGWMNSSLYQFTMPTATETAIAMEGMPDSNIAQATLAGASSITAIAGQGIHRFFGSIDRSELDQEIPILQAILMALCLALGPLILVLGGYRINVIFSYYFILSSIISITFVEKLLHYLEMSLHASQSYGVGAIANTWIMYNIFTKMYFYAPLLYLMLMSICGVSLGSAVAQAFGKSASGDGAGLAKTAGSAITKVFKA